MAKECCGGVGGVAHRAAFPIDALHAESHSGPVRSGLPGRRRQSLAGVWDVLAKGRARRSPDLQRTRMKMGAVARGAWPRRPRHHSAGEGLSAVAPLAALHGVWGGWPISGRRGAARPPAFAAVMLALDGARAIRRCFPNSLSSSLHSRSSSPTRQKERVVLSPKT